MTEVVITGPFDGYMTALYGDGGVGENFHPPLIRLDLSGVTLSDRWRDYIFRTIPLRLEPGYEQSWGGGKLKFAISSREVDFEEDFWKPYNKKINKKRCEEIWEKMKKQDRMLAVAGTRAYLRYLGRIGWRGQYDPENFLKKKAYLNNWDEL